MTAQTLALLLIELLDELVFGAREAAWPLIQDELALTYVQMGLLLGLPNVIGNVIELSIGVLADVWKRRLLIVGGGIAFALALLLTATGRVFLILLGGSILLSPASGAFVGLSQATLMDVEPTRRIGLGIVADRFGLGAMMWLLIAGPAALLVGIPKQNGT